MFCIKNIYESVLDILDAIILIGEKSAVEYPLILPKPCRKLFKIEMNKYSFNYNQFKKTKANAVMFNKY